MDPVNDTSGGEELDPASGRIIGAGANDLQRSIDANTRAVNDLISEIKQDRQSRRQGRGGSRGGRGKSRGGNSQPSNDLELTPSSTMSVPSGIDPSSTSATHRVSPRSVFERTTQRGDDGSVNERLVRRTFDDEGRESRNDEFSSSSQANGTRQRTTNVRYKDKNGLWQSERNSTTKDAFGRTTTSYDRTSRTRRDPFGGFDAPDAWRASFAPPILTTDSVKSTRGSGGGSRSGKGSGGGQQFFKGASQYVKQFTSFGNSMLPTATAFDNYAQWAGMRLGAPSGADGTDGAAVNALRKLMFGSMGGNSILWAKNATDAGQAALTATTQSGFTNLTGAGAVNPLLSSYMGGVKDLSVLNPTMSAQTSAQTMGTLTSGRGLYASMLYGYTPVLGQGGRVNQSSLGSFTDSVMRAAFGKNQVGAANLAAALGQNGNLNKNIEAYVSSAGGNSQMVTQLENYITGRNSAALHGMSGTEFDKLMHQYEQGGTAGRQARDRLRKAGVANSILQSQREKTAQKTTTTNDLLDQFGPAVKKANDALGSLYTTIDKLVNLPGLKDLLGGGAGWATNFGSPISTFLGSFGGSALGSAVGGIFGGSGSGISGLLGKFFGSSEADVTTSIIGSLFGRFFGNTTGDQTTSVIGTLLGKFFGNDTSGSGGIFGSAVGHLTDVLKGFSGGSGSSGNTWTNNPIGKAVSSAGKAAYGAAKDLVNWGSESWPFGTKSSGHTTGNDGRSGGASTSSSHGAVPGAGQAIVGATASGAIQVGLSEIGRPYQWGGVGPNAFDCSGLMQYAYQHGSGVTLPRTSEQQMGVGAPVGNVKEALPGDLMFPNPGHVVMYLGGNKILEAPHTGADVRIASVTEYQKYAAIRRIVGSVGSYGSTAAGNNQTPQSGTSGSGNIGSPAFTGDSYGSSEEIDNVASAIASVQGILNLQPMGASASPASSSSSGSSTAPNNLSANAALGKRMAAAKGWTGSEWNALYALWTQESGWNANAVNPSSGAYGIPQALGHGHPYNLGDASAQIAWGINYIGSRYGDPVKAEQHEKKYNWYNTGAWNIPEDQISLVHKGEMILEKPKADTIRNALMRDVVQMKDPAAGPSGSGSGGGVTLNFASGSVQFNVTGAMTAQQAQSAADSFAQALASNERMQKIGAGL